MTGDDLLDQCRAGARHAQYKNRQLRRITAAAQPVQRRCVKIAHDPGEMLRHPVRVIVEGGTFQSAALQKVRKGCCVIADIVMAFAQCKMQGYCIFVRQRFFAAACRFPGCNQRRQILVADLRFSGQGEKEVRSGEIRVDL